MFKLFTKTPRFTKKDKEEAAELMWDVALESANKGFEGKSDELADHFFGLFDEVAVSVAKAF